MPNYRKQLQDLNPRLITAGISYFGKYDLKRAESNLKIHDHGSNYEIVYLDKGMQPYYIYSGDGSSRAYNLQGGEVFITRPYERHSTGDYKQLRGCLYWIQLDADCRGLLGQTPESVALLNDALSSLDNPVIPVPRSVSSRLKEAFALLYPTCESSFFRACQLICLFILELAEQNKKLKEGQMHGQLSSQWEETVSFIDRNLLDPKLSVQMITEHLHYSRSYIMTSFRREFGTTLHEYILRKKIDYACRLLLDDHNITEISFLLNFSSSQHFSKVFKDHTKMTPSEYRTLKKQALN